MIYEIDTHNMFLITLIIGIVFFAVVFILSIAFIFRFRKSANKRAKERGYDSFVDYTVDRGMQMNDKGLDIMDQMAQGKATINVNHTHDGNGNGSNTVIKVRCPHCGYLESEDAVYCSKCGKSMKQGF